MLLDSGPMVFTSKRGSGPPDPLATEPQGSHLARNPFFPIPKTWGSKRLLPFLGVNSKGELINSRWRSPVDARQREARAQDEEAAESEGGEGGLGEEAGAKIMVEGERKMQAPLEEEEVEDELKDGALEEVRAKLVVHLREAAERVQLALGPGLRDQERDAGAETERTGCLAAADATKPWNLRARTAKRRVVGYGFEPEAVQRGGPAKPARQRSWDVARRQRPRFSVSLTAEEVAEDIYAVTGSLPRRRPKRRARVLQRQLDALFPGSWLTEITPDSYKVPD